MALERVLLVDDDEDIRMIAEMSLSQVGGWKVTAAESGRQAIESLREERPDLILLDYMMPGESGKDTFVKLREMSNCSEVPVIFLTARVQRSEVEELIALGAAGVIAKPFDPMTLPDEIRRLLGQA